jgi:hypothetical protein
MDRVLRTVRCFSRFPWVGRSHRLEASSHYGSSHRYKPPVLDDVRPERLDKKATLHGRFNAGFGRDSKRGTH